MSKFKEMENREAATAFLQETYKTRKKNEFGFSLVILTSLMPLILTFLCFIVALSHSLIFYHQSHHLCRIHLLKAQDQVRLQMEKLIKLNPKAKILRVKMKKAKNALKKALSTKNYIAITLASAEITRIVKKQMRLRSKQKEIKSYAKRISKKTRVIFRRKITKINRHIYGTQISSIPFSLTPQQLSLTPSYRPSLFFVQKQKASASWRISVEKLFPSWIQNFLDSKYKIKGQCAATLNKGESPWIAQLIKVKK